MANLIRLFGITGSFRKVATPEFRSFSTQSAHISDFLRRGEGLLAEKYTITGGSRNWREKVVGRDLDNSTRQALASTI